MGLIFRVKNRWFVGIEEGLVDEEHFVGIRSFSEKGIHTYAIYSFGAICETTYIEVQ